MRDFLIIGGGIIGLLTAHELLKSGAKVTLLERGELAQESSWAGGGIISPLYPWRYLDSINHLAKYGQEVYPALCDELHQKTGINPEYTTNGLMIFAEGENLDAKNWAQKHHRNLDIISPSEIKRLEPELTPQLNDAFWLPTVGQVRNPRIVKALIKQVGQLGAEFHTQTEMMALLKDNAGRVSGVQTNKGNFLADSVIICGGAWTASILEDELDTPAIRPMRGQMILFQTKPGTISRMVLEENRYIIPRQDGRVLFGSTIEDVGFEKQTTDVAHSELHNIATSRFPVLKKAEVIHHWAGLRPGSPAGVPYIAQHNEFENLFINAGHFRNGVVLGPASARLMADMVLHRNPILDPAPYSLTAARG